MAYVFVGNGYYLAIGGAIGEHAWCHLKDVIFDNKFDVELQDISESVGLLSIQGPYSRPLLEKVSGEDLSNEAFPFSTHKTIYVAGHRIRALRLTFVGELGWELHIPAEACADVYRTIMDAGREFDIVNGGL